MSTRDLLPHCVIVSPASVFLAARCGNRHSPRVGVGVEQEMDRGGLTDNRRAH